MKNQKGISLIALIITIIVIIILAAIVIGSIQNAPDQANFAKYCQDYSEIQSAVSTQGALVYGQLAVSKKVVNLSIENVYSLICTATAIPTADGEGTITLADVDTTSTKKVDISATANMLGLSSVPSYQTWSVSLVDEDGKTVGELSSNGFHYDGNVYTSPTEYTAE